MAVFLVRILIDSIVLAQLCSCESYLALYVVIGWLSAPLAANKPSKI